MNRIDRMFAERRLAGKKAFVGFVTAGDPDIETTCALVREMEEAGAALIELGVPFSDPIAEGAVIQEANVRALSKGINLDIIMDAVEKLRRETDIPLVYLMYYNSILSYGSDNFFARCAKVGIDGVIIPDLPFEESGEIAEYTKKYGVYQISLVSPSSTDERLRMIAREAKGFLYCVSSMGVTGVRDSFTTDFDHMFKVLNSVSDVPKCIGFGISKPEQAKELKHYCDGVIVGSAIVRRVAAGKDREEKLKSVSEYVRSMCAALVE